MIKSDYKQKIIIKIETKQTYSKSYTNLRGGRKMWSGVRRKQSKYSLYTDKKSKHTLFISTEKIT